MDLENYVRLLEQIKIRLHQESILSSFLITQVMNNLKQNIQDDI